VAIKPVSTIGKNQNTYDFDKNKQILQAKGRHDPCVLPRAMPIIEAMAAIVTGDHCLLQAARKLSVENIMNNNNNGKKNFNVIDSEEDDF
jgi:chorismate synthase